MLLLVCAGAVGLVGCDANATTPSSASTTTSVAFTSQVGYSLAAPTTGTLITLSVTVAHTITSGTAEVIPSTVLLDDAVVSTGMTGTIPANGTLTTSITVQTSTSGGHTMSLVLDAANRTGVVSQSVNLETSTITVMTAAAG